MAACLPCLLASCLVLAVFFADPATKMRIVAFVPDDGSEAVVAALVCRVMARPADHDAVVDGIRSSEFNVSDVMRLRPLAKKMSPAPSVA